MLDNKELAKLEQMSKEDLIRQIKRLDAEVDKYCTKVDRLHGENQKLRMQPSSVSAAAMDALRKENEHLKMAPSNHSEVKRGLPGAGRKPKADAKEVELIKKWAVQGHSLSDIAARLEAKTGTKLSRSTVRNMIYKQL